LLLNNCISRGYQHRKGELLGETGVELGGLTNRQSFVQADAEISLTQNATKHSFPCCAVKSCPLVNDCDLLAGFCDFYPPLSHLTPSLRVSLRAIGSYLV